MPRLFTSRPSGPAGAHRTTIHVAGTPAQLIAYYRGLVEAGIRYFICQCGQDRDTLARGPQQMSLSPPARVSSFYLFTLLGPSS